MTPSGTPVKQNSHDDSVGRTELTNAFPIQKPYNDDISYREIKKLFSCSGKKVPFMHFDCVSFPTSCV